MHRFTAPEPTEVATIPSQGPGPGLSPIGWVGRASSSRMARGAPTNIRCNLTVHLLFLHDVPVHRFAAVRGQPLGGVVMRNTLLFAALFAVLGAGSASAQKAVGGTFYGGVPVPMGTTADYVGPKI